jgi:hypothetical protein
MHVGQPVQQQIKPLTLYDDPQLFILLLCSTPQVANEPDLYVSKLPDTYQPGYMTNGQFDADLNTYFVSCGAQLLAGCRLHTQARGAGCYQLGFLH